MTQNWKRIGLILTEIIILVSSLSLDLLPQAASSPAPTGDDALLLMVAVYSRLEASSGAAVLPSAPHNARTLPVLLSGRRQQTVQDQINENEMMAELYWSYFENAKDDKQKEYFAGKAQAYSDAAKALDTERDRKRRRPGIARFFRGVGRVINKVVGGIVVGGAKATEFIVDEALPLYIQLMIKTLPDKHINLMWDKLASRLGGGPAGEYLVKKIRKFIDPYFVRMRDHIFKHREPNPIKTEEVDAPSGDSVSQNYTGSFNLDYLHLSSNEIITNMVSFKYLEETNAITGSGQLEIQDIPAFEDDSSFTDSYNLEFEGTYNSDTESFTGLVHITGTSRCFLACDGVDNVDYDYYADWNARLVEGSQALDGYADFGAFDFKVIKQP